MSADKVKEISFTENKHELIISWKGLKDSGGARNPFLIIYEDGPTVFCFLYFRSET